MKTLPKYLMSVALSACAGVTASGELLAYYGNGTDEDADALFNLAPAIANVTVSSLSDVGAQTGDPVRITRPMFATNTPAGPTAGSDEGSEWFEARSTENQGVPGTVDNYFFFTVVAGSDSVVSLETLKYDFWVSSANGATTVAAAECFVSVDDGAFTSFGSITATDDDGDIDLAAPVATANIDLSSIVGATSVEVRIAIGYSQGNTTAISGFVQGIQLEGSPGLPSPNDLSLIITPNSVTPGSYDFTWNSQATAYDLVSSTDLSAPVNTWEVWQEFSGIIGSLPTTSLTGIPGGSDGKRFFAIIERSGP